MAIKWTELWLLTDGEWQSNGPNYGCLLSVCVLYELRSATEVDSRNWLAFDIECAIRTALAVEVWRANGVPIGVGSATAGPEGGLKSMKPWIVGDWRTCSTVTSCTG